MDLIIALMLVAGFIIFLHCNTQKDSYDEEDPKDWF